METWIAGKFTYFDMALPPWLFLSVSFLCFSSACKPDLKQPALSYQIKNGGDKIAEHSLVYRWAEKALEATSRDTERFKPRPTVTSRYLGLYYIAVFDAWSMYDQNAI